MWAATLEIADALDDVEYQLRALWGLWNQRTGSGDHRGALAFAKKFHSLAASRPDPAVALIGNRIIGVSLHYLGYETEARWHVEHMLAEYVPPANGSHTIRFQTVQRITARSNLAWCLWIQGLPEQAMRMAFGNVEDAEANGHALSLCHALEAMCLVALYVGDCLAAERAIGMLRDHTAQYGVGAGMHGGAVLRARCSSGPVIPLPD